MSHRIAAALILWPGLVLAQDDPRTVGVSVEGTLVEIPVEQAAEACGLDAEALLAEWDALGADLATMADTSVAADATDLAPEVGVDTPMDAAIDGETVADGADATSEPDGDAAVDLDSDAEAAMEGDAAEAGTTADAEPDSEPGLPADGTMDAGVEATTADAATGDDASTADAATSAEADAGAGQEEGGSPATPTEGTAVSKAAVCEVSRETAEAAGIALPG